MACTLIKTVKEFLATHFVPGHPILLGFSGGSDSLVLLDLLCQCRSDFPLEIHLAHVDHGWREESSLQAQELQKEAEKKGLAFHLHRCTSIEKNEELAREQRLQFFNSLYNKLGCQALILAHHADDQAETVLKRIFEGAHLTLLGAMAPHSHYQKMVVWRPLIDIPKKELTEWLEDKQLSAIEDATNFDPRYLRAKMRMEMIPSLSKQFGKEIAPMLGRLAKSAHELRNYFSRKTLHLFSTIQEGPFGIYWDFNPFFPLEKMEIYFAVKKYLLDCEITLNHISLELLVSLLARKASDRKIGQNLIVDRGILFILKKEMPLYSFKNQLLQNGVLEKGDWAWSISCRDAKEGDIAAADWKDLWKGKISFLLPEGDYEIASPDCFYSTLKKYWLKHKIPAFLRKTAPLIVDNGKIIFETKSIKLKHFISIEIKSRD